MSYDLNIFRKNNTQKLFSLKELAEKFHTVFDIFERDDEHLDAVEWFTIHYSDKSPNDTWEFAFQKDLGCYTTSCSYGTDKSLFLEFRKLVLDVAVLLDAQIQDPQIDETLINPKDFTLEDTKSTAVRTIERQLSAEIAMQNKWTNATPSIEAYCSKKTDSKYFILYFIASRIPKTDTLQYLVLDDGRYFASKVNVGETLTEVLNREVPELTGSSTYYVEHITDAYDTAPDRNNNYLPRTAVLLRIPYFLPDKVKTKYPMKWIEIPNI